MLFLFLFFSLLLLSSCEYGKIDVVNECQEKTVYEAKSLYYDDGTLYYSGVVKKGEWATIGHVGEWIPCGQGKMFYHSGKLYHEGGFKNGWRDGEGTTYHFDIDGLAIFSAYWKNDSPYIKEFTKDKHTIYFLDGEKIFYEGEWLDGLRHGQGKSYYENGQIEHEGEYAYGFRNGIGKYYGRDGTFYYEGNFRDGVPYGQGDMHDEEGVVPLHDRYGLDYKSLFDEILRIIKG